MKTIRFILRETGFDALTPSELGKAAYAAASFSLLVSCCESALWVVGLLAANMLLAAHVVRPVLAKLNDADKDSDGNQVKRP